MKKVIIIGASSGIGKTLAQIYSRNGYEVGITARRQEKLQEIQNSLSSHLYYRRMDIAQTTEAIKTFQSLVDEMKGVDIVIISAGIGYLNSGLDYAKEQETIDVNVSGFVSIADTAFNYFLKRGDGHIVGISSIAALRGGAEAPAYNASKAFISNYMKGLRELAKKQKKKIYITDIQPGFVDTAMAKSPNKFWVEPVEIVAHQTYRAIENKKKHAYVTKKWRLIAWVFKILPI